MQPTGTPLYPSMAVISPQSDAVDMLLKRAAGAIASTYKAECWLWADLDGPTQAKVYATEHNTSNTATPQQAEAGRVRQFSPRHLPLWLLEQQRSPQMTQLETGELVIPITSSGGSNTRDGAAQVGSLQLVLQLRRARLRTPSVVLPTLAASHCPGSIHGWSAEELKAIQAAGNQLGMTYTVLSLRQRLEQSRRQVALIGRIAHLLNSNLEADAIVKQIVAELGQVLQCDRCILVNLRDEPVNLMASWDHPERSLPPFPDILRDRTLWGDAMEALQDGASYWQVEVTEGDGEHFWLAESGADSALLIPLFIHEEFFGAVGLLSYGQVRAFQLEELQTACQVADHAAIALTNAQHYQNLWHKHETLRLQTLSLQRQFICDELTQLLNRQVMEREFKRLSSRALWTVQQPFSLILCDLDYFKLVNDQFGHAVGDQVLRAIAQRLQQQLRQQTPAYRYGGEEFVILLTETSAEQATDVAERLRQGVQSQPVETTMGPLPVTMSFGVAQQQKTQDRNAWDVLLRAEVALLTAKQEGQNSVKTL